MTTRQRLNLLSRAYPRLFPRRELLRLLEEQLGQVDALDKWFRRPGSLTWSQVRAPGLVYHICAGNLAVSAQMSLGHGLLLGAMNVLKLPGDRDDLSTRREILDFIRGLPAPLRKLVKTERELDPALLRRAEVVIAFGSDATMASLRAQTVPAQKFIAHGHALSLLWLAEPERFGSKEARACAVDVLTYDQLGCLSPQAIYAPPGARISEIGGKLARALETAWRKMKRKPARPITVAARITEARDVAHGLGHRVWLPPTKHLGWTVIHDPKSAFRPSALHGIIYLRQASPAGLKRALASVAGKISTVGVAGKMNAASEKTFLDLGVTRFCAAGKMQFPPLTWHHDGRPVLAELVTWIDRET
ncbi:MAG: hypothetical protein LV479_12810 [Methylacidiphilales bacterium]|nr:hypothetical protein [Candidatus Methylacidiphilales bacterium]